MPPLRVLRDRAVLALGLSLAAAAPLAQAALLYSPSPINASARTSDFGSGDRGFRTFDNFTVASGGLVERITWRGFWFDFNKPQPEPAPAPDVLSWDIAFHASAGGAPGGQLLLKSLLAGEVTTTFLGNGVFNISGDPFNVAFFEYSVDLSSPFAVAAGVEYWVSVLAQSDEFYPAFAWQGATGGDSSSYQQTLGSSMNVTAAGAVAADRQVVLEGTLADNTVPEPASWALALGALAVLAGLRRQVA